MQNIFFEILVQTALTVGLFWTILKLTPKSALLSFTILYSLSYIYPQQMKLPFCLKLGPNKIETLSPSTFGLTIAKQIGKFNIFIQKH